MSQALKTLVASASPTLQLFPIFEFARFWGELGQAKLARDGQTSPIALHLFCVFRVRKVENPMPPRSGRTSEADPRFVLFTGYYNRFTLQCVKLFYQFPDTLLLVGAAAAEFRLASCFS